MRRAFLLGCILVLVAPSAAATLPPWLAPDAVQAHTAAKSRACLGPADDVPPAIGEDAMPPFVQALEPSPGSTNVRHDQMIRALHDDAGSGISATAYDMEVWWRPDAGAPWLDVTCQGVLHHHDWTTAWLSTTPGGLAAGEYSVAGHVEDNAGNRATFQPASGWRFTVAMEQDT